MYRIFPRPSLRATANSWWLVAFIFIMFATGTLNFACNTRMTQLMFINKRAFPGGPMAWFFTNYAITVNTAGNSAYIIANFFADALLVSRVMRMSSRLRLRVTSFGAAASCGTLCGS